MYVCMHVIYVSVALVQDWQYPWCACQYKKQMIMNWMFSKKVHLYNYQCYWLSAWIRMSKVIIVGRMVILKREANHAHGLSGDFFLAPACACSILTLSSAPLQVKRSLHQVHLRRPLHSLHHLLRSHLGTFQGLQGRSQHSHHATPHRGVKPMNPKAIPVPSASMVVYKGFPCSRQWQYMMTTMMICKSWSAYDTTLHHTLITIKKY